MPIRWDVDPGGEWLIPFAKKKLAQLKAQFADLGIDNLQRWYQVDESTRVGVASMAGFDRITVRAGAVSGFGVLEDALNASLVNLKGQVSRALEVPAEDLPALTKSPGGIWFVAKDRRSVVVMRERVDSGSLNASGSASEALATRHRAGEDVWTTPLAPTSGGSSQATNGRLVPGATSGEQFQTVGWNHDASKFVLVGVRVHLSEAQKSRAYVHVETAAGVTEFEISPPREGDIYEFLMSAACVSPNAQYMGFFSRVRDSLFFNHYYVGLTNLESGVTSYTLLAIWESTFERYSGEKLNLDSHHQVVTDDGVHWVSVNIDKYTGVGFAGAGEDIRIYKNGVEQYRLDIGVNDGDAPVVSRLLENYDSWGGAYQQHGQVSRDGSVYAVSVTGVQSQKVYRVVCRSRSAVVFEASNTADPVGFEAVMVHPVSSVGTVCFLTLRSAKEIYLSVVTSDDQLVEYPVAGAAVDPADYPNVNVVGCFRGLPGDRGAGLWADYDASAIKLFYLGAIAEHWALVELATGDYCLRLAGSQTQEPTFYPVWPFAAKTHIQPLAIYPQQAPAA